MTDKRNELIDVYAGDFARRDLSYTLMGMMLDRSLIRSRLKDFDVQSVYIYGGNSLGVQLYRCIKDYCKVKAFIETDGYLYQNRDYGWKLEEPDVSIFPNTSGISFDKTKDTVIICELNALEQVKDELKGFIDDSRVVFINEFLFGGIRNAVYD